MSKYAISVPVETYEKLGVIANRLGGLRTRRLNEKRVVPIGAVVEALCADILEKP